MSPARDSPASPTPEEALLAGLVRPEHGLILALDVSSSVTGYAVGSRDGVRTGWGAIIPREPGRAEAATLTASGRAVDRIDQMVSGVRRLTHFYRGWGIDVVMEWSSGKLHRRVKGVATGLAVLGQAQGAVRQALNGWGYDPILVAENDWTKGKPKAKRADGVGLRYPPYARADDPGLDMADALGLLDWYRGQETTRLLVAAHGGPALDPLAGAGLGIKLPPGTVPGGKKRRKRA